MRLYPAVPFAFVMMVGATASAQRTVGPVAPANVTPKLDLALGFDHVQANAPPGVSDDFGLNGGFVSAGYHFNRLLAVVAEGRGGTASHISSPVGQDLTLTTYLAGPRVTFERHRVVPFGQVLFGAGHGSNSYFPTATSFTTSATSFAYAAGGGVDINLTHRFAVRAVQAEFLHTGFANGSSNTQRQLAIGAGIVLKFGGHVPPPPPAPVAVVTRPQGDIHFTCSLNTARAEAGQRLTIIGNTMTEPDHLTVMYTWMPEAGMIEGTGAEVKLNTATLLPGHYLVRGHAAVVGDYSLAADCEMPFEITAPAMAAATPPPPPPVSAPEADAPRQKEFHANVPDAYFDYNSAAMRPDARAATTHAADFLNQHAEMRVRVEGFADERGSVEYNLMLGQQRAEAARNALIAAGVEASRVEIISFGKADPVCAAAEESCYRQNRRAAFSLHP